MNDGIFRISGRTAVPLHVILCRAGRVGRSKGGKQPRGAGGRRMSALGARLPSISDDVERCETDVEQCAEPALASRGRREHVLTHLTTLIAIEGQREGARARPALRLRPDHLGARLAARLASEALRRADAHIILCFR